MGFGSVVDPFSPVEVPSGLKAGFAWNFVCVCTKCPYLSNSRNSMVDTSSTSPNKHAQLAIGYRNVSFETHTQTLTLFSSKNLHSKAPEKHADAPPLSTPHVRISSVLLVRRRAVVDGNGLHDLLRSVQQSPSVRVELQRPLRILAAGRRQLHVHPASQPSPTPTSPPSPPCAAAAPAAQSG